MKHLIMGTAGHVDHGKTALIKALTGIDCDTHKQEKERGITINLGFSHLDLPSGTSIGIIDVPGHKNWVGQVRALHGYVQRNVQYVRDIRGVETIATPLVTIQTSQGDCDDQAVLLASLLESIGHPTRFVAIKQNMFGPFVHVYTETKIGPRWIPLETTEKMRAGTPMKFSQRMVVNN